MSDEQGHHRRMPDPGTPFPIVAGGNVTFGYKQGKLTITGDSIEQVYNLSLPGSQFDTLETLKQGGHLKWGYHFGQDPVQHWGILFAEATSPSDLASPISHGTVETFTPQGSDGIKIKVQGEPSERVFTGLSNAAALHGLWSAGGGLNGSFKVGVGQVPDNNATTNPDGWAYRDDAKKLVLILDLGVPTSSSSA